MSVVMSAGAGAGLAARHPQHQGGHSGAVHHTLQTGPGQYSTVQYSTVQYSSGHEGVLGVLSSKSISAHIQGLLTPVKFPATT